MKKQTKILVVDDDTAILDAISMILIQYGYNVVTLSNAAETQKTIQSFRPDLLLIDMLLRGFDGRSITKEIKQNSQTQHIPVVMMAAHPTALNSVSQYGVNDTLAKPFETKELLNKIKKHL